MAPTKAGFSGFSALCQDAHDMQISNKIDEVRNRDLDIELMQSCQPSIKYDKLHIFRSNRQFDMEDWDLEQIQDLIVVARFFCLPSICTRFRSRGGPMAPHIEKTGENRSFSQIFGDAFSGYAPAKHAMSPSDSLLYMYS